MLLLLLLLTPSTPAAFLIAPVRWSPSERANTVFTSRAIKAILGTMAEPTPFKRAASTQPGSVPHQDDDDASFKRVAIEGAASTVGAAAAVGQAGGSASAPPRRGSWHRVLLGERPAEALGAPTVSAGRGRTSSSSALAGIDPASSFVDGIDGLVPEQGGTGQLG
jgi:hypothetical protein